MADNKFERVADDSPDRCQAVTKNMQCPYKHMPMSKFCPMHGGNKAGQAVEAENKRMYRLAKWQDRMGQFADHEKVKSLREEIGILRILMEEIFGVCQTPGDVLMYSSKIADLAIKLEKLISSCNRLEASTGMLLDKQSAIHLASVIVKIIGDYVKDEDVIEKISGDIITAIVQTHTEKEVK